VTLTLEVVTYNWYATHHLVMVHVPMKFHEILFNCLEVVVLVWIKKKAYLTSISGIDLGGRNP